MDTKQVLESTGAAEVRLHTAIKATNQSYTGGHLWGESLCTKVTKTIWQRQWTEVRGKGTQVKLVRAIKIKNQNPDSLPNYYSDARPQEQIQYWDDSWHLVWGTCKHGEFRDLKTQQNCVDSHLTLWTEDFLEVNKGWVWKDKIALMV